MTRPLPSLLLFCCAQPLFLVFGTGLVTSDAAGGTNDSLQLSKQPVISYNSGITTNVTVAHLYRTNSKIPTNTNIPNQVKVENHSNQREINQGKQWAVLESEHSEKAPRPKFGEHAAQPKKTYISMQKAMRNMTKNVGAKAIFYCDIVGKPIPQIHWYKDQKSIVENPPKIKIETGLWGSSLRIDQVQKSDEGVYLCVASNPSGTLNVTARLRVTDKAKSNFQVKPQLPDDESLPLPETDGFCQDFHSNVCGKFLIGHRVYVTREFQQAFTETQISKFLKLTAAQPLHFVREDCLRHIMEAMCYYNFPICLPAEAYADSPALQSSRELSPYEQVQQSDTVDTTSLVEARHQLPQVDYQPYYLCQQDCHLVKQNECQLTYEYLESTILRELPGMIMNCARLPRYSMERLGVCRRLGDHEVPTLTIPHNMLPSLTSGVFRGNAIDHPGDEGKTADVKTDIQLSTTNKPVQLRGQLPTTPDFVPIFISISVLILMGILVLGICFICRRTRDASLRLQADGSGIFNHSRSNGGSFSRLNVMHFDSGGHLFRGQGVGASLENASNKKRRVPGMGSGIKTTTTAKLLNSSDENYCLAYTQVVNANSEIPDNRIGSNGLNIPSSGIHHNHIPVAPTSQATTASYHQYGATNCTPKSMPPPNSPAPPPPAFSDFQRNRNNYYNSNTASNSLTDRPEIFRRTMGDPLFSPMVSRATVDSSPTAYTTLRNTSPSGVQTSDPPSQLAFQFCPPAEELSEQSDKPPEYAISQLRFGKQFGQGVFGPVYKAELLPNAAYDNGIPVSVIVKTLSAGSPATLQNDFKREAELISGLDHPNVLSMLGVSMQHPPWCMIFEIRQYLDLCELMSARRNVAASAANRPKTGDNAEFHAGHLPPLLSYMEKLCVLSQVAAGMEYLSSHRFVHRDLAARNVIIVTDSLHCKITDLGLARDCYVNDYYRIHPHSLMLPIRWMPIDSIIYGKFTVESDIWAFGVLMWEIWSNGGRPYSSFSDTDVLDLIRARQLLQSPVGCPVKIYAFMHHCWSEEAERRPSFKDCIYQIDQWQLEGDISEPTCGVSYNPLFSENNSNNVSGARGIFMLPESVEASNQTRGYPSHHTSVLEKPKDGVPGDPTPSLESQRSGADLHRPTVGCGNEMLLTRCSPHFSRSTNHVSPDGSSGAGIINSVNYLPCAQPSADNTTECSPVQAYYDSNGTFINFGLQMIPNGNNVYLPTPEPVV